jgi:hypothetical protein
MPKRSDQVLDPDPNDISGSESTSLPSAHSKIASTFKICYFVKHFRKKRSDP